jgi:starvation-inducible DNA-binding protein
MTTKSHTGMKQGRMTLEAQPKLQQRSYEIQPFGQQHTVPIELPEDAIKTNVEMLNRLLADSITLYLLYKKHHWQVAGPTFYQLHLLLDEHADQVLTTVDLLAERIQALGGVSIAMPQDVSEMTQIERPPRGEENIPSMLARTVNAHSAIIKLLREAIEVTEQNKDWGTNDMLMSDILRMHERQVWFISQHLVDTPLVESDKSNGA